MQQLIFTGLTQPGRRKSSLPAAEGFLQNGRSRHATRSA